MKKILIAFCFLISAAVFFIMIAASSPYRELRPYIFFGKKIPDSEGIKTMTFNGQLAVLVPESKHEEAFYIDQIPVTVGAYKRCTALGYCKTQHYRDVYTKFYINDLYNSYPVSFVTFDEARTYCRSFGGDLPTAAQWQLASGNADYSWGAQDPTLARANIDGYYQWQIPAGWLPEGAGPYGTLDMSGNVREWILSENPANRSERGLKGGAFQDDFGAGESDYTFYHEPTSSGFNRGFRCVFPAE